MRTPPPYTVAEVAHMTGYSRQTVMRLFENVRGVYVVERPAKMNKRRYRAIRIPRAVYERVVGKIARSV